MTDLEAMLKRQADWQKSRRSLTWPEKIRMAERVRPVAHHFFAATVPRRVRASSCAEPSRTIRPPHAGHRICRQGVPRPCGTRCSHFTQTQKPPGPRR
jgi:hypothetical protein